MITPIEPIRFRINVARNLTALADGRKNMRNVPFAFLDPMTGKKYTQAGAAKEVSPKGKSCKV